MSSKESIKRQLIKETALNDLKQANMLKGIENMGKVKSYYHNELLLERENDIKTLNKNNQELNKYVAKLRYALLEVRTNLIAVKADMHVNVLENIESATDKIDTCRVIIKDVLNDG
tara:strand:- start:28 stop:375 length:348 start_codon:yes stop_codon:yes gene_type:complete